MTRSVWEDAWLHSAYVKGHLPTAANEGFTSPIHMMTAKKILQTHILLLDAFYTLLKIKNKCQIQRLILRQWQQHMWVMVI